MERENVLVWLWRAMITTILIWFALNGYSTCRHDNVPDKVSELRDTLVQIENELDKLQSKTDALVLMTDAIDRQMATLGSQQAEIP